MNRRWESDWMAFQLDGAESSSSRNIEATSLEFAWRDVVGYPSGKLKFIVSNNQRTRKLLKEIAIDTANNEENSYFLNIYFPSYLYYKIIYEPNGIVGGRLYVGALYR